LHGSIDRKVSIDRLQLKSPHEKSSARALGRRSFSAVRRASIRRRRKCQPDSGGLCGARPDSTYDPTTANANIDWELYREMWGSDGEFVIDGNLRSVEYLDRLATIRVPTLMIAGDHDECDPALAREMQEKIGGSKLVILPNSGHTAFEDQPELWIEQVRDFINQ
jgi:pimeloyl-ACP methyl ester carboxylesterase